MQQAPVVPPMVQGSTDRMADFFHSLKGAEGTLRQWNTQDQPTKLAQISNYERPEKTKTTSEEEHRRDFKAWHTFMCGVVFMEALAQTPDRLVAQTAFDWLYPGKVGKR